MPDEKQYRVKFQPQGRTITVLGGTIVLEAAARVYGEDLARRARHLALTADGKFQTVFMEAMIFPKG